MAFKLALGRFALAARRSHPDKLAKTQDAASHADIAAQMGVGATEASGPLVSCAPPTLNQGQSGSCTAHSFVAALATRCKYTKQEPSFLASPRECYACTRAWERTAAAPSGPLTALTDSGAELADVVASVAVFGVSPIVNPPTPDGRESDIWTDADVQGIPNAPPANVNLEPDGQQLEAAAADPLSGAYTIRLTASNAVSVAVAALAAGMPLYVGFFCDTAFQNLQFGQVAAAPDQSDPNGGGHAVFLIDSRPSKTVAGTVEFLLDNSWGSWAGGLADNDGMVWVSEAFFLAIWEAWVVDEKLIALRKAAA